MDLRTEIERVRLSELNRHSGLLREAVTAGRELVLTDRGLDIARVVPLTAPVPEVVPS